MRGMILLLLILLPVITTACGGSPEMQVDEGDSGSQVSLSRGQTLVVTLAGNPTTGYIWERAGAEDGILEQRGEPAYTPDSDLIGSGGVQVFRFRTAAAGETTLRLVYRRPWEKTEPLDRFEVEVVVN